MNQTVLDFLKSQENLINLNLHFNDIVEAYVDQVEEDDSIVLSDTVAGRYVGTIVEEVVTAYLEKREADPKILREAFDIYEHDLEELCKEFDDDLLDYDLPFEEEDKETQDEIEIQASNLGIPVRNILITADDSGDDFNCGLRSVSEFTYLALQTNCNELLHLINGSSICQKAAEYHKRLYVL